MTYICIKLKKNMTENSMCPEVETGIKTINNTNMISEYLGYQGFHYNNNGLYYSNGKILKEFIKEDKLKEFKACHYLAVVRIDKNGNVILKYGYTSKNPFERYANITTNREITERMIEVWSTNFSDHVTIKDICKAAKVSNCGFKKYEGNSGKDKEMFVIENLYGFLNFNETIKKSHIIQGIGESYVNRNKIQLYDSVIKTIYEIEKIRNEGYNVVYADLCARFGKTPFSVELFKRFRERIMVLTSYVGTVCSSYEKFVNNFKSNEHIKILDADKCDNMYEDIKSHLDASSDNKVIVYVQLTGDNSEEIRLFNKRICGALSHCKEYGSMLVIEEADYGSKRSNQIKKLKYFCENACPSFILVETGTNIESTYDIFKNTDIYKCYKSIRKNYIIDVLGDSSRKNVVKINYHTLCNYNLMKHLDGYTQQEMENFAYFFSLNEDGSLKGKSYLEQLVLYLFNTDKFANNLHNKDVKRIIWGNKLINDNFATAIFVPERGIKVYGSALVKLVKSIVGDEYEVCLITGDTTTNKDAEDYAKDVIKNNWNKNHNNKVIFIMGSMASRSWSVEEIKNIVLMIDGSGDATLIQKISRGLTPITNKDYENLQGKDICNIIDFRLSTIKDGHLNEFISGVARSAIRPDMDESDVMKILCDPNKINFYEYFSDDKTYPIKRLSQDDLYSIFRTKEYERYKTLSYFTLNILNRISNPKDNYTGADGESPTGGILGYAINNAKGDNDRTKRDQLNAEIDDDGNEETDDINKDSNKIPSISNHKSSEDAIVFDRKMQHIYFLLNNIELFNTYKYYGHDDWVYKEFEDIKNNTDIKKQISKRWNVDMDTIIDTIDVLKNGNHKF